MSFADEITQVLEGELSHRITFPGLGLDIRGQYDRYSAEFDHAEGAAVVANRSRISISRMRVSGVLESIQGAVLRVYDPFKTGSTTDFEEYRAGLPQEFEDATVEIELEKV